jgi:hypothetical protein
MFEKLGKMMKVKRLLQWRKMPRMMMRRQLRRCFERR